MMTNTTSTEFNEKVQGLIDGLRALAGGRTVVVNHAEDVMKKVKKLGARAKKLGLAPLEAFECETHSWVWRDEDGCKHVAYRTRVVIFGASPAVNGYAPIARLEHSKNGNVVQAFEAIDEAWRTAPADCAHCNTRRDRKNTILFREESTGKILQIGKSCAADYCRTDKSLTAYLSGCFDLFIVKDEDRPGPRRCWSTNEIAAYALAATRNAPYVSKKAAGFDEGDEATASMVRFAMGARPLPFRGDDSNGKRWDELQPTGDEWIASGYLCGFWAVDEGRSDYAWNLRTIARNRVVIEKQRDLWVSAVIAYRKATNTRIERMKAPKRLSVHLGTVGGKIRVNIAKIEKVRFFDNDFGGTWFVAARTVEGASVSWTQSTNPDRDSREGWVTATVKSHGDFKGHKQTKLSRVSVSPDVPKWTDGINVYKTKKAMEAARLSA